MKRGALLDVALEIAAILGPDECLLVGGLAVGAHGYVRATGGIGPRGDVLSDVRAYVDVTYVSRTYLAPSELKVSPARTFLGLGLEVALFESSLLASFSVRDALNVSGTDFLGYPLSGRSFSGSVSYRKEFE